MRAEPEELASSSECSQLPSDLGRMGKDLTGELEDIYRRLNDAMEDAA